MKLKPALDKGRARARQRGRVVAPAAHRAQASGDSLLVTRRPRAAHAAGDPFDKTFASNHASSGSADADWLPERLLAVARTRHVIGDEPLAASAAEQKVSLIVGDGWRFEAAPKAADFGLDPASDEYDALAQSIEAAWELVAEHPLALNDWEERLPFDLQLDLLTRNYIGAEGEGLALILFDPDSASFGTRLQVIDPDRLAQPVGWSDGLGGEITIDGMGESYTLTATDTRAGIAYDDRGRAIAYHILDGHPQDIGISGALGRFSGRWYPTRVPGFPTDTRPCVLHVMKTRRAGQSRGISDFVAALGTLQTFRDMSEAERRSRLINALIVAQYTSSIDDPEVLAEVLGTETANKLVDNRIGYYEEHGVNSFAGSRIIQPYPGDELKWNSEMRSANEWVDAMSFLALQAGAPIGLGLSLSTRDFSKTTFSSARTEIQDAFRGVKRDCVIIKLLAARKFLLAVLQEAYEDDRLAVPDGAPSIWDRPDIYVEGLWVGHGMEHIDPVKGPMGDRMEVENLTHAPSDIAARRGQRFSRVLDRTARDKRQMEKRKLTMGDIGRLAAQGGAYENPDADQGVRSDPAAERLWVD